MPHTPYVSDGLVHFVGRSATSDEEAFDRLVAIMKDGWLRSAEALTRGIRDENRASFTITPSAPFSGNEHYVPGMVCFADIPAPALKIHTDKYRRFGLAFPKTFLIAKGARPVNYVPRGAKTQPLAKWPEIGEDWDELVPLFATEVDPGFGGITKSSEQVGEGPAKRIAEWVDYDFLAFVKFFDPTLPEDHVDNYYMEREWRCVRSIEFQVSDIACVYVAPGYGAPLVAAHPAFASQVREL
jgi:hypothetical protein